MVFIASVLASPFYFTAVSLAKDYVVHHDGGGNIDNHDYYWHQVRNRYDRVVIDGDCISACTMVLGIFPLDHVCITPRGAFAFHAAHPRLDSTIKSEKATERFYSYYAQPVRDWVNAHHAMNTVKLTWLRSKDVFFIAHCPTPKHAIHDAEMLNIINSERAETKRLLKSTRGE